MANLPIGPHRVEAMLQYLLDLSKQLLEKHGAFFPFGAVIDSGGNRRPVAVDTGTQSVKTAEVYRFLQQCLKSQFDKGEIIAGAIVAEASIPPELKPDFPDGLRITVESGSISRLIFLPYQKVKDAGAAASAQPGFQFRYGELLGIDVVPTLFADPAR